MRNGLRSSAPWLDPGMIVRGEVCLVHPFRGVSIFVPGNTPAFIACGVIAEISRPCDTEQQS